MPIPQDKHPHEAIDMMLSRTKLEFFSPQLVSPVLRNLTLASLVLTGGVVAALPFRKPLLPSKPQPSDTLLTGPALVTTSPVAGATTQNLSVSDVRIGLESSSQPMGAGQVAGVSAYGQSASESRAAGSNYFTSTPAIASDARVRGRRDVRLPLTYEDLAVPLQESLEPVGRFEALARNAVDGERSIQTSRAASSLPGNDRSGTKLSSDSKLLIRAISQ